MKKEQDSSGKRSRNERIEAFLRERYAFRYNTVKSRTEYRAAEGGVFQPVTKFCLNSIRRELDRTTGITTSAENVRAIFESDFAERVTEKCGVFHSKNPAPACPSNQ